MAPNAALVTLVLTCAGLGRTEAPPSGGPQEEWPKLLRTHEGWSYGLAFSPDGKALAAGGREGGIRADRAVVLWDVATGKRAATLDHRDLWAVAFSPDGKTLATGGDGIRLWDVAARKAVASAKVPGGTVRALAFSPDGKLLAFGAFSTSKRGNTVGLWEVDTLKAAAAVPEHTHTVSTVAFSPDGKTLAFAGDGEAVRLWGVDTGRDRAVIEPGGKPFVHCVAFNPDGKTLAVALGYRGAKSPARANIPAGTQVQPRPDHRDVTLWDTTTGKPAGQFAFHEGQVMWVAYSPDGKLLASASSDRTVLLWDVASKKSLATLEVKTPEERRPQPWVDQLAFSPDGKVLAVASRAENAIRLWSLDRGK